MRERNSHARNHSGIVSVVAWTNRALCSVKNYALKAQPVRSWAVPHCEDDDDADEDDNADNDDHDDEPSTLLVRAGAPYRPSTAAAAAAEATAAQTPAKRESESSWPAICEESCAEELCWKPVVCWCNNWAMSVSIL